MRGVINDVYIHLIWSTWDRLPLIRLEIEGPLYAAIQAKCRQLQCELISIGGVEDHIHLLVRLPTIHSLAEIVKQIKGSSSHLMTHEIAPNAFFKWQGSYAAISVSPDALPAIQRYIQRQKEHHAEDTYVAENEIVKDPISISPEN